MEKHIDIPSSDKVLFEIFYNNTSFLNISFVEIAYVIFIDNTMTNRSPCENCLVTLPSYSIFLVTAADIKNVLSRGIKYKTI